MRPDLTHILDAALERLRAGATIEECLRAYPEHAAELEPMLRTADAMQRQARATLPPSLEQWLASGRSEIEQIAREAYSRREPLTERIARVLGDLFASLSRRGMPRLASAALSALVICFMALYTVDSAAAGSLPGDYLYDWKLFSEQARITLAVDPNRRAQLAAASVERRVAEIGALAGRGEERSDELAQTVERLDIQVQQALDMLDASAGASPEVRDRTMARIGRLLVRAGSDLREAGPADQPPAAEIASAVESVEAMIEVLPAEPPAEAAVIVPAPDATPEPSVAAQPQSPAAGGAAPSIGTPIRNPGGVVGGSISITPSPTPSSSATAAIVLPTLTPTTAAASPTVLPTSTPEATRTALPTRTPVAELPSATTAPLTATIAPSSTPLPTSTAVPTATQITPIVAPTEPPTLAPTQTPAPTATATVAPTVTATVPPTATATVTDTVEPTATPSPTATSEGEPPVASATPSPTATSETGDPSGGLRPILECVQRLDNGRYVAYFGYRNNKPGPVEIPIGPDNRFSPSPEDRGQPTRFPAGRSEPYPDAAFKVTFDGSPLVWLLDGATATASSNSAACK